MRLSSMMQKVVGAVDTEPGMAQSAIALAVKGAISFGVITDENPVLRFLDTFSL